MVSQPICTWSSDRRCARMSRTSSRRRTGRGSDRPGRPPRLTLRPAGLRLPVRYRGFQASTGPNRWDRLRVEPLRTWPPCAAVRDPRIAEAFVQLALRPAFITRSASWDRRPGRSGSRPSSASSSASRGSSSTRRSRVQSGKSPLSTSCRRRPRRRDQCFSLSFYMINALFSGPRSTQIDSSPPGLLLEPDPPTAPSG
jgi:hypothetical protein